MRIVLLYIVVLLFVPFTGNSQRRVEDHSKGKVRVVGEDSSTPGYILNDVVIQADNTEYLKKYRNAKYFIRRIYAYSQLASAMLNEYQDTLLTMSSEREKNKYLKQANKELKEEFGDEIREMSVTRGRYLNKLIYRETGLSTFDIIKDYRGGMKAFFWQSLCKINGQDLKVTYDSEGEDAIIERVVREIEEGKIKYLPRVTVTDKGKEVEDRNKNKRKDKRKKKSELASK